MHMRTLVILLLSSLTSANYIQVPAAISQLHQLHRIDSVFDRFGLKRIFKKEVTKIVDSHQTQFPICYEQMPFATFQIFSSLYVGQGPNTYGLIYEFEKIKNRRNLIDIEMIDQKIFYVREDGFLRYVSVGNISMRLSLDKQFKTIEDKIHKGSIVILPNATSRNAEGHGLFINHQQAVLFDLQANNFTQIEGFKKMTNFETAVAIEEKYFAAAYGDQGVVIYSLDLETKSLKVEATFNKDNLEIKASNFKGLAYDHSRKLLFMLDHNSGVLSLQLVMVGGRFQAQTTSSVIKHSSCTLLYYDSFTQELYLNCRELMKYHLSNWPILQEKVMPKQEISVRSMSSWGGKVVLAGRNVFEMISEERKVAIYEDKLLEKFTIKDNVFLSANYYNMFIGKYKVIPPQIICQSENNTMAGNHLLLFKITAQCNLDYFKTIGFEPGTIFHEDKCLYSVYQRVSFWEPKEVNVKPFFIIIAIIVALGLGLLIWWCIWQFKLKRLESQIEGYDNLIEEQVDKPRSQADAMGAEVTPSTAANMMGNQNTDGNGGKKQNNQETL